MTNKYAAFGTTLNMGTGARQVETATVVGTIEAAGAGNAAVVVTMGWADTTLAVPVANDDTAALVAGKIRTFIATDATAAPIRLLYAVSGASANVVLTRKIPAANDATLNISIDDGTSAGLTAAPTSTNTTAGETLGEIASVQSISGPGLSVDTEDVTTHDQAAAWEEVVATIIRSGEMTLDIVYDPADGTHDAATGLTDRLDAKTYTGFSIVFPGSVTWAFGAYVTGFEPGAPHDGALTAAVKLKLSGAPVLA